MKTNTRTLIGFGKISKLYTDGEYAYKTYPDDYQQSWIDYEYQIQKELTLKTDLPILIYEYLPHERELKMKWIQGKTLADRMRKDKYLNGIDDLISLQCSVYSYHGLSLPNAFDECRQRIEQSSLSDSIKKKALVSLNKIPYDDSLCHFDFHFENILFNGHDYFIIDWVNAKLGNPTMDIARSYVIMKQYAKRLANNYLKKISKAMDISMQSVLDAVPLMASLRLLENDAWQANQILIALIFQNNNDV